MKMFNICAICVIGALCTSCYWNSDDLELESIKEASMNYVCFFERQDCPCSQEAKDYIQACYPYAKIIYLDLETDRGQRLMSVAQGDYKLGKRSVSTPFICLGNSYIEGWDAESQALLDELIERYIPKVAVAVTINANVPEL